MGNSLYVTDNEEESFLCTLQSNDEYSCKLSHGKAQDIFTCLAPHNSYVYCENSLYSADCVVASDGSRRCKIYRQNSSAPAQMQENISNDSTLWPYLCLAGVAVLLLIIIVIMVLASKRAAGEKAS